MVTQYNTVGASATHRVAINDILCVLDRSALILAAPFHPYQGPSHQVWRHSTAKAEQKKYILAGVESLHLRGRDSDASSHLDLSSSVMSQPIHSLPHLFVCTHNLCHCKKVSQCTCREGGAGSIDENTVGTFKFGAATLLIGIAARNRQGIPALIPQVQGVRSMWFRLWLMHMKLSPLRA